jgi:hypothetical protein
LTAAGRLRWWAGYPGCAGNAATTPAPCTPQTHQLQPRRSMGSPAETRKRTTERTHDHPAGDSEHCKCIAPRSSSPSPPRAHSVPNASQADRATTTARAPYARCRAKCRVRSPHRAPSHARGRRFETRRARHLEGPCKRGVFVVSEVTIRVIIERIRAHSVPTAVVVRIQQLAVVIAGVAREMAVAPDPRMQRLARDAGPRPRPRSRLLRPAPPSPLDTAARRPTTPPVPIPASSPRTTQRGQPITAAVKH